MATACLTPGCLGGERRFDPRGHVIRHGERLVAGHQAVHQLRTASLHGPILSSERRDSWTPRVGSSPGPMTWQGRLRLALARTRTIGPAGSSAL